jgi:hypothetical protein
MDTGKVYYDTEGNECSIWQMVMREPHWAANRIQEGEKALEAIARLRAEAEANRVDAERYRWVKSQSITDRGFCDWKLPDIEYQNDFDAAIDAARGKDNG